MPKKQVSGSYFYNYHGIRNGLCHDLLQYCAEHRNDDK